jgi:hypothetical protein
LANTVFMASLSSDPPPPHPREGLAGSRIRG